LNSAWKRAGKSAWKRSPAGFAFNCVSALCLLVAGAHAFAQAPAALMTGPQVNQLCERSTQLMEAGGVAVADLQRAAAPVIENVRQACLQLRRTPNAGQPTYVLMMNLRAYLGLADAVPKPFPFPEAARQQFAELRDDSTRLDSHFRALLDLKDAQLRSSDPDNLQRYAEANRKLAAPNAANARVVFLGDSITDFWRLNEYFPDRDFVNRGISGQTTGQLLGRMKADVLDVRPQAVLIQGGTNDLAREVPLTAIENNYLMMAELAATQKIKVIFASVLPVSDYHKDVNPAYEVTPGRPPVYIKALNEWLQGLCSQRGYIYLNYFPALVDGAGQFQADLADDGLHPNAKGYRIMAPLALEAIAKTVSAPQPSPSPGKPGRRRETSSR
jgi:lysophospholipase L1-like esterase